MSLYDKASLVQIPSGVKSGTLYNVVPNTADGDFEFDRSLNTATRVNKDGLIETVAADVPRLDYPLLDGVVQDCPALLLEPSRTNSTTYSEELSNAAWTKANVSVVDNQITSPNGSVNADTVVESTSTGQHFIGDPVSLVSGTSYVFSIFAKKKERTILQASPSGNYLSPASHANFDLENGVVTATVGPVTASIIDYGDGWYRCTLAFTATASNSGTFAWFLQTSPNASRGASYTGDGTSGMYLWGGQFETGSYPTSYIPTSGSAVTRIADVCNGAGTADTFNDSEGVLFAEIAAIDDAETNNRRLGLTKDGTFEGLRIQYDGSTIGAVLYDGTTNQYSRTFTFSKLSLFAKVAFKYKASDFAVWINGFEYGAQASGSTFSEGTLDDLSFDYVGSNNFYGKTKQLMTFNEALSDTELENLTSWDSFREMATEQLYSIE